MSDSAEFIPQGAAPIGFGLVGMFAILGHMAGVVPVDHAIVLGMFGSFWAAFLGFHARAMGWYDA